MGTTGGAFANINILKMVRLVRLAKLARLARIMRAVPELMTLVKGIFIAIRAVFFTLLLEVIFVYVFAIAVSTLTKETPLGWEVFDNVPNSMWYLFLWGVVPDNVDIVMEADSVVLSMVLLAFLLMASLTLMNMLLGVMCEVIT